MDENDKSIEEQLLESVEKNTGMTPTFSEPDETEPDATEAEVAKESDDLAATQEAMLKQMLGLSQPVPATDEELTDPVKAFQKLAAALGVKAMLPDPSENLAPNVVVIEANPIKMLRKKAMRAMSGKSGLTDQEKLLQMQSAYAYLGQAIVLQKEKIEKGSRLVMLTPVNTAPDLRETEQGWTYTARSGVQVHSTRRPPADRWMDDPRYHVVWSYTSWATMILQMLGWEVEPKAPRLAKILHRPRKALKARGWW